MESTTTENAPRARWRAYWWRCQPELAERFERLVPLGERSRVVKHLVEREVERLELLEQKRAVRMARLLAQLPDAPETEGD